jgi:D-threo-aldose 1-dehydrogenase
MSRLALGLGCAELFRLPSPGARRRMLEAAFAAGIRHFDVAPMYGLGLAESELGAFARHHRGQLVLATKFGIDVTPAARALGVVQAPLRRMLSAHSGLRARARADAGGPSSGRLGAALYRSAGYDAAAARAGLEESLRRLRVDHIDLFLLHDPVPGDVSDDVAGYLEQAVTQGLIGGWGVAGEPDQAFAVAGQLAPEPDVVQFRDDAFLRSSEALPPALTARRITFGALSQALARIVEIVGDDAAERRRWSDRIDADAASCEVLAPLLLRDARRRNPDGITLFGTIRQRRLEAAVAAAASDADDERVDALTALIAESVAPPDPASIAR